MSVTFRLPAGIHEGRISNDELQKQSQIERELPGLFELVTHVDPAVDRRWPGLARDAPGMTWR
jgi:hypothetical protein